MPPRQRHALRGARGASATPAEHPGPVTVQRRVSRRGQIMVATQKIQVGLIHAGAIVTVTAHHRTFRLAIDDQIVRTVPRTTREIHRYKAYQRRREAVAETTVEQ